MAWAGNPAEGIPWIEQGIRDFRALGVSLTTPYLLALKAEALHLANRLKMKAEGLSVAASLRARRTVHV